MQSAAAEASSFEGSSGVAAARHSAVAKTDALGFEALADNVAIVVSELVTNALLHGGGCTDVRIDGLPNGVRVSVQDRSRSQPLLGHPSDQAMTGRGLRLVGRLTSDWGVRPADDGKCVWADVTSAPATDVISTDRRLEMWGDVDPDSTGTRLRVELGEVSTEFLLEAKAHVDNLVREFNLISSGAADGVTEAPPPHLAELLSIVTERFAEARLSIKEQALRAAHRGVTRTSLVLELTPDAAEAGEDYVRALDELDDYCRANRLFTLETEPEHRVFRRWYVGEIVAQLRAAAAGLPRPLGQTFDQRVYAELREIAHTQRVAERAARLFRLARALAVSATPEAVADAVLNEGVAALRADAGGLLLTRRGDAQLALPGAIGYDDDALSRLRSESRDAELPAAVALRTGEPVWLETREERDQRFPGLLGFEPRTEAICAVPLTVGDRTLGALRFSFKRPRVFDDEERQFVVALADQTAQALDRAQLQHDRIDISRRLQHSLLPPDLPDIPGVDIAAVYHPFGDGVDVGGDFYDAWYLGNEQWAIAIGDASGTGPEAAALTAVVRHSLRALALSERRPAHVLRHLNTLLISASRDRERFCTAMFGVVTVGEEVVVELATGGHPPPIVRHADGTLETAPLVGSLLGMLSDASVGEARLRLDQGSMIVLYTDGVIEARSPDRVFFDEIGIERALREGPADAATIAARIEDRAVEHGGGIQQDDMAIVVLRVI